MIGDSIRCKFLGGMGVMCCVGTVLVSDMGIRTE